MPATGDESATERLRDEHVWILRVPDVLERLVERSEAVGSTDFEAVEDCVTFVRLFADACHHGKEEDLLFPALEERGMPRHAGPIAVMLEEHRRGREHARRMREALGPARAGDEGAQRRLRDAARDWVELIRGHILKEDHGLFELADEMVPEPRVPASVPPLRRGVRPSLRRAEPGPPRAAGHGSRTARAGRRLVARAPARGPRVLCARRRGGANLRPTVSVYECGTCHVRDDQHPTNGVTRDMRLRPVPASLPLLGVLSFALAACAPSPPAPAGPRLRVHALDSEIYGNERLVRVWLPRDYGDPAEARTRYPVLYLNDGQNVFDTATALFGDTEWRADEVVDSLITAGRIPPVIVVGIDNAGRSARAHEYLPYPDEYLDPPEPDPRGDEYAAFLRDEVFPLVDGRYRTRKDARILGGSSYGALVMLYAAATAPDLANSLLLESPSLYVDHGAIFDAVERADLALRRVYVGIGTNEMGAPRCEQTPDNVAAVDDVRRLARLLDSKGRGSLRTRVRVEECATHGEAAWARRLPAALEFLLGA